MPKSVNFAQWYLAPYCIGMKLRALRTQKRLTLSRLAAETGLSTALLSKLETDRMIPTLPTLATISRVYGVGLSYFFSEPGQHTVSITRKSHLQAAGRGAEQVRVTPLHAHIAGDPLLAKVIDLAQGGTQPATDTLSEVNGLLYVIEGKLQLDLGELTEELDAGDCAYLKSKLPLMLTAAGRQHCRVLAVTPASGSAV